jgi:hypothetical protein
VTAFSKTGYICDRLCNIKAHRHEKFKKTVKPDFWNYPKPATDRFQSSQNEITNGHNCVLWPSQGPRASIDPKKQTKNESVKQWCYFHNYVPSLQKKI